MGRGHFVVPLTDEQRWWNFGAMWRDIGACCPWVLATARQAVLAEREACADAMWGLSRETRDASVVSRVVNDGLLRRIESETFRWAAQVIEARPPVHS